MAMLFIHNGNTLSVRAISRTAKAALSINELSALFVCRVERIALHQEVMNALGVGTSTVSDVMQSLTTKGYIKSGRLKSDSRVACYTLTAKGQRVFTADIETVTMNPAPSPAGPPQLEEPDLEPPPDPEAHQPE
jgi:DNA-binding MarR family transcriptional regulator